MYLPSFFTVSWRIYIQHVLVTFVCDRRCTVVFSPASTCLLVW